MITQIKIDKVPIAGRDTPTSPAEFNIQSGILHFGKSPEWSMMVALDLIDEYMSQILTHEEIHAIMDKVFNLHLSWKQERLIHLDDICALMGF